MQMLQTIKENLVRVRPDLSVDWLEEETRMRADLGMTSIELLNLLALVTQAVGTKIMYEPLLLPGGTPRPELTLGELAAFVETNRNAAPPAVVPM